MSSRRKPSGKRRRKNRYVPTLEEKVTVLDLLKSGMPITSVARLYGRNESSIRAIKIREKEIRQAVMLNGPCTTKVTTRDEALVITEMALSLWLSDMNCRGVPVSDRGLQEKALSLYMQIKPVADGEQTSDWREFKASQRWLYAFKKRFSRKYKETLLGIVTWVCLKEKKKCKGRLRTRGEEILLAVDHQCGPPEEAAFTLKKQVQEAKKRAREEAASGVRDVNRKEREAAIKAGLIPPDDASTSESSPDPQPGTSQDPPLETSLKNKPATYSKIASRAAKEQLSEQSEQPGSWNTNEVFIKQEVDLSDDMLEDDNSIGNNSVGESELPQVRQPDLSKAAGNGCGSTELSQQRSTKKRKAALEHAYIRPHLPVTVRLAQEEKSSPVESQSKRIWDTISTESAEQSSIGQKRKSQETPYETRRENILHQKEELEAVLLRLQVKKLLLEMEKISEERERIAVEKSNITLRYKCLELREKLNDSILSGAAAERLGCASSLVPTIIVDSSSAGHSKCNTSTMVPGSKSFVAGNKTHAPSLVKSRQSSSLSGKDNVSSSATSNEQCESDICNISAENVSSSKAAVQHTSEAETIQDSSPPKRVSSVSGGHKVKVPGQDKLPLKQTQQKQTTSKMNVEISNVTDTKSKIQSVPSNTKRSSEVCLASVPSVASSSESSLLKSHSLSVPSQISETAKTTLSRSVNTCIQSLTQQPDQELGVKDEPVMTKLDTCEKMTVSLSPSQTSHMAEGLTTCSGGGRRNTSNAKKYSVPSSEQPGLKVSVKEPVESELDIAEETSEPSYSHNVPMSSFKEGGEQLSDSDQLAKKRKLS